MQNITHVTRDCGAPLLTFSCQKGRTQTCRRSTLFGFTTANLKNRDFTRVLLFTIGRDFCLLKNVQAAPLNHTAHYSTCQIVKLIHSPPSSTEVKNEWSYFFDGGHSVVLIMAIILYIKQSCNTTFSMYLITVDI